MTSRKKGKVNKTELLQIKYRNWRWWTGSPDQDPPHGLATGLVVSIPRNGAKSSALKGSSTPTDTKMKR